MNGDDSEVAPATLIDSRDLTLSLGAALQKHVLVVKSANAVAHGFDRVRFPAPMFVGDHLRLEIVLVSADELDGEVGHGVRLRLRGGLEQLGLVLDPDDLRLDGAQRGERRGQVDEREVGQAGHQRLLEVGE